MVFQLRAVLFGKKMIFGMAETIYHLVISLPTVKDSIWLDSFALERTIPMGHYSFLI